MKEKEGMSGECATLRLYFRQAKQAIAQLVFQWAVQRRRWAAAVCRAGSAAVCRANTASVGCSSGLSGGKRRDRDRWQGSLSE